MGARPGVADDVGERPGHYRKPYPDCREDESE
jgi:hypothetical protein